MGGFYIIKNMTVSLLINTVIFVFSFFFIWFGAGLIVKNISKFSHHLKISSFSLSFFLLGFLTTLPELTVGINAIFDKKPEIFVGNLIGGIVVLFSLIIPLLTIVNGKVILNHDLDNKNLILVILYLILPLTFIADQKLNLIEGIFLIVFYLIIFYLLEKKQTFLEKISNELIDHKKTFFTDILKILLGIGVVVFASHFIVEKTIYFSRLFHVSPFFVALIIISLGTNLPELSLIIRSIKEKKQQIAFGDYLGSATTNVFVLGILTIVNGEDVFVPNHFYQYALFILISLILFYLFIKSENKLSVKEALVLLFIYIIYLFFEIRKSF